MVLLRVSPLFESALMTAFVSEVWTKASEHLRFRFVARLEVRHGESFHVFVISTCKTLNSHWKSWKTEYRHFTFSFFLNVWHGASATYTLVGSTHSHRHLLVDFRIKVNGCGDKCLIGEYSSEISFENAELSIIFAATKSILNTSVPLRVVQKHSFLSLALRSPHIE